MSFFAKASVWVRRPIMMAVPKDTPLTYIGPGHVREVGPLLQTAGRKKVLVIGSHTLHKSGALDAMLQGIADAGIEVTFYEGVKPDPTFAAVQEACRMAQGCDAVVAVGGGSVLDTAKTVCAAVANDKPAAALAGLFKVKKAPLMLITVPTTAGTGSETTVAAVISDSESHAKKQILDPKLPPFIAILDPELTATLPQHTTAETAMDALTHALEAYVSTYANEKTDLCAEMAVRLIYRHLPTAYEHPENMEAREGLLVASFLAGMAFTRTYVGYVHAFSHAIGGRFGVSHGLGNAVLLPHIMEYYLPVCEKRFARLSGLTGTAKGSGEAAAARDFVESIYALGARCGIPARLQKFPKGEINSIISMAFKECHGTYPVPRYYSRVAARALLEQVCAEE